MLFNSRKCNVLHINSKSNSQIPLTINGNTIEYVNSFKYLGDELNIKGNNDNLILSRIKNVHVKMIGINAICKQVCLCQHEVSVLLKLYESIFLSSLLFNCQTWTNLRASDIKALTTIQLKYLKQSMKVPYGTPNNGVFLELGILPIKFVVHIRKLTYLHHILNLPDSDPVKELYQQQLLFTCQANWANEVKSLLKTYDFKIQQSEIEKMTSEKWKNLVKNVVSCYAFNILSNESTRMSKLKRLSYKTKMKTQSYIKTLTPEVARNAFRIRVGMVDIRSNYKNKYHLNCLCQICYKEDETLQHVVDCNSNVSVDVIGIYNEDVNDISEISLIVMDAIKNRDLRLANRVLVEHRTSS